MAKTHERLHQRFGRWGWLVSLGLAASLALQIFALTLPFIEISIFLQGDTTYGLLTSVRLMWQSQLYVISILIAGFSVVFPFLKLIGLALAWFVLPPSHGRTSLIRLLGARGKWSMMDPLCITLLVAISSGQWAISATTHNGIYCFLSAVALAMTLSLVIQRLDRIATTADRSPAHEPDSATHSSGRRGVLVPLLLLLALASLFFAIDLPLVQVDQFMLKSNAFGMFDICSELWTSRRWALALLCSVGLLIFPVVKVLAEAFVWIARANPRRHPGYRRAIDAIAEWSMIDVFALSLVLFLLEGGRFIKTEAQNGLWFIALAVVLSHFATRLAARRTAVTP